MIVNRSGRPERDARRGLQREMLQRTRLLDILATRTQRVATVISAGAGFGKSTLIAQAMDDRVPDQLVHHIVHRVTAYDTAGDGLRESLARQIADIARPADNHVTEIDTTSVDASAPSNEISLSDQLWHLSPTYVTIVIDDIHLIAPGSPAWTLLNDVVLDLPDNSDAILSGRGFHELTLARLIARGEVVEIDEKMLAFTPDELDAFAALRDVERNALDDHGWPALTELEAHAGVAGAHEFVAQEVLDALPDEQVAALRLVAPHDSIDDELVTAVTDFGGDAEALVGDLPLTSQGPDGSWILHDLWRSVLMADLSDDERRASLVGGAQLLRRRGQLRAAIAETIAAGDDGATIEMLVEFARDLQLVQTIADRRAIIDLLPERFDQTAEVELLRADIVFAADPLQAAAPLQRAIDAATEQNRPEVTVLALLRLGDMAYRSGDRHGLIAAQERLARLERLGGTGAEAALVLTDSWLLLLENAAEKALDLMGNEPLRAYPPVASMVQYYRAVQFGHAGRARASLDALDELSSTPDSRILERRGGFAKLMKWWLGELDDTGRAENLTMLEQLGNDRQHHLFVEAAATAALISASAGDVHTATDLVARSAAHRDRIPAASWGAISVELATAVIELMGGDDAAAAARLEEALPETGPFEGFARHVFGNVGALLYALVPRSREFFDAETTGPDLALATQVGTAIVALREHGSTAQAGRLPWNDLAVLRTWAYEPHLAELAIAAMSTGNVQAGRALATIMHNPRGVLRSVIERHEDPIAALADAELAHTPNRPALVTHVNVMGPTRVSTDGTPDDTAQPIKRKMVRELLLLLVHRKHIRRDEICALLWPDKDDGAARNNLRVTLSQLRIMLEQDDTDAAGPPWHVRSDGESLELFSSDRLVIDADAFASTVSEARRADRDRLPGPTLAACRTAIALYRGDYAADALDPDWAFNQRMTFHLDYVEMCTRASELCEGRRDDQMIDDALEFARRAVDAEPLSERAHRALVRALRASGDRPGAKRAFQRALDVLEADGLHPDTETVRLGSEL